MERKNFTRLRGLCIMAVDKSKNISPEKEKPYEKQTSHFVSRFGALHVGVCRVRPKRYDHNYRQKSSEHKQLVYYDDNDGNDDHNAACAGSDMLSHGQHR